MQDGSETGYKTGQSEFFPKRQKKKKIYIYIYTNSKDLRLKISHLKDQPS